MTAKTVIARKHDGGSGGAALTLVLSLLLLPPFSAAAMDVEFDIQPRIIQMGEAATCTVTFHGVDNPGAPNLPPLEGFQVQDGIRQEESFSFGPGGQQRTTSFRHHIVPTRTGQFTIGPFRFEGNGQTFDIPAIQVQVVMPGEQGQGETQLKDLLFAKLEPEKTEVFNQEVFDLYISVFSRGVRMSPEVKVLNLPASGLSLQQLQELRSTREVVNGQAFDVRRFRTKVQALTAGTFRLEPAVQVVLRIPSRGRRSGFFDDPFFDRPIQDMLFGTDSRQPVALAPEPVDLVVKPLPDEGRPDVYSGAVGTFSFDVQVKPTELTAGEPVTVTTTISGKGNIDSVSAPVIVAGDELKVYEPKLVRKDISQEQAEGSKRFEQVVIPKSDKIKELPAVRFAYFDPASGRYEVAVRGPFQLAVAPPPEGARLFMSTTETGARDALPLGRDIVYLKPAPKYWHLVHDRPWYRSPLGLGIQAVPPVVLAAFFLLTRRREALSRDPARMRRLQAPRSARAALNLAEMAAQAGDRKAVYESLAQALADYFGNRLNLAPGEVSEDVVTGAFRRGGLPAEQLAAMTEIFRVCEEQRFGRDASPQQARPEVLHADIVRLTELLRACEKTRL